ncbi:MAG: hypothetical protein JST42_08200 [Bacteroidetes bacterium]|nr:hypothetical protein [Bacteroidota bacterium]
MRNFIIYILAGLCLCAGSCYKDKGNYSYNAPARPVVTGLDSIYPAIVGDSLIVAPTITIASKARLGYEWRIMVGGDSLRTDYYHTQQLRILFALSAQLYAAQLTVVDSSNGMKYFFPFQIQGSTIYSNGYVILSEENGTSQLSFVQPDGAIQPGIYSAINKTELPPNCQQIVGTFHKYINNGMLFNYWVLCSQGDNPGVELDPNSLQKVRTLRENFFNPPATIAPGYFVNSDGNATMFGVLNGQLWSGAYQTSPFSPVYDQFSLPATGNYQVFNKAIINLNAGPGIFLGYEVNRKQIVAFTNYGSLGYAGTGYQKIDTAWDPTNIGLNVLDFEQPDGLNGYVFGTNASDSVYEYGFTATPAGPVMVTTLYKRPFPRQDLVKPDTKWIGSKFNVFYFTSGSTIYSYNPVNKAIAALDADFGGKSISMLKISSDGNTLTTGVDGSVLMLDVSVGKNGNVIKRIDKVPGAPIDVYQRTK